MLTKYTLGTDMKFPVLGLMIAVVLGQYGLMVSSNTFAMAVMTPDNHVKMANLSDGVFCRADRTSSWSCPQG